VELFGVSGICGVGFGMGDVTLFDFLAVHSLLPQPHRGDLVLLAILPDMDNKDIHQLAQKMRANGIATEVPWGISKLGKQLQSAEKKGIRYAVIQGSEERKKGQVLIKDLKEGQQAEVLEDEAYLYLKNKFGKG
jgi:histidyl-tRNA synthetase